MKWTYEQVYNASLWKKDATDELVSNHKLYQEETLYQEVSLVINQGIPYLVFECFKQQNWMKMAFSTRLGGESTGYLSEMNFGWNRGDADEVVRKNYREMANALQISYENYVFSDQVHDTKVSYVDYDMSCGKGIRKKLQGIDGLFTDQKDLVLATSYADCVPLFFADPVHQVIASSHSGWKGTVGQIGAVTIQKMANRFGTKPEDVICLIGPSICQNCYEVSEDVIVQIKSNYSEEECEEIFVAGKESGKYQLDLWAACYLTLKKAGVLPKNIQVSRLCTCCHSDLLFSHRATQGKRGNLNGFIWKTS